MRAHGGLGNDEQAAHHQNVAEGLLESICRPSEGRTPEKPCPVITTSEEYFYMHNSGLVLEKQTLSTCDGRPCDIMKVHDKETGDKFALCFDITFIIEHMSALLGGEPSN